MANFNRIASYYDFLKQLIFKDQLDKAAAFFIKEIPSDSEILIIGGGSGQLLTHFNSTQKVTFVEASERMTHLAEKRKSSAEIVFHTIDIFKFYHLQTFDVVITPFFLDCFNDTELNNVFANINHLLKKGGLWLHSDFYPKNNRQQIMVSFMYYFFKLSSGLKVDKIPNFDQLFKQGKFIQEKKAVFSGSMIHSYIYKKIA